MAAFAFAHLETAPAQDWITVGDEILIQVSSGPFLDSMSFHVREIWRPDSDFLLLPDLASDSHDRMQRFAFVSSLPYALSDDNIGEVKTECRRYIKGISKSPSQALDTIQGNTSAIVWRSLQAIMQFLRMNLTARQANTPALSSSKLRS